jgi:hypothetical protein
MFDPPSGYNTDEATPARRSPLEGSVGKRWREATPTPAGCEDMSDREGRASACARGPSLR